MSSTNPAVQHANGQHREQAKLLLEKAGQDLRGDKAGRKAGGPIGRRADRQVDVERRGLQQDRQKR